MLATRMAMRTTYGALLASFVVTSSVSLLLLGCGTANGNGPGGTSGTGPTCTQPDGTRAFTLPPSSSGTGVEAVCVDGTYHYGSPLNGDCPAQPTEVDVYELLQTTCGKNGASCASTDSQGTCSITCVNGTWAATNATVCSD